MDRKHFHFWRQRRHLMRFIRTGNYKKRMQMQKKFLEIKAFIKKYNED